MADTQRWAEAQIKELIAAGVSPQAAEASVRWVLDNLPAGADPATWVPGPELVAAFAEPTEGDIKEARAEWYAAEDVPARFKRILDAGSEGDDAKA